MKRSSSSRLLKTFGGWTDHQLRNATIIWISPTRQICITTHEREANQQLANWERALRMAKVGPPPF